MKVMVMKIEAYHYYFLDHSSNELSRSDITQGGRSNSNGCNWCNSSRFHVFANDITNHENSRLENQFSETHYPLSIPLGSNIVTFYTTVFI